MNTVFIGIDPSLTNTGVCVLNFDGSIRILKESKAQVKQKKFHENPFFRLQEIASFVEYLIPVEENIFIAYEDYSYQSVNKPYLLGELGGVLKTMLINKCKSIALIPPTVLKKFAVGHGSADKKILLSQLEKEKNITGVSSDICDAYFLAKMAQFIFSQNRNIEWLGNELLRNRLEIINNKKYVVYHPGKN